MAEWVPAEANQHWDDAGMISFDCPCGAKDLIAHAEQSNIFELNEPAYWEFCDCGREYRVQPAVLMVRDKEKRPDPKV